MPKFVQIAVTMRPPENDNVPPTSVIIALDVEGSVWWYSWKIEAWRPFPSRRDRTAPGE